MSATDSRPVLWKKQAQPDNYIHYSSFLSGLRRNPNFKPYTYWTLVRASCPITQHVAVIFIFIAVFVRLRENLLDPRILIWISMGCYLAGYTLWEGLAYSRPEFEISDRTKTLKSSILVLLALIGLSPVLRTLTAATSSDSIWALSACLFILNALLADYSSMKLEGKSMERLTSVLSMNAAVSASVVLASRLSSDVAVFALVLFSVNSFALFPILRRRLQNLSIILQAIMTILLSAIGIVLTAPLSTTVACIYLALLPSVTFCAPAMLVWAQKHKNELRGPWDVAVPKVN